MKNVIKRLLKNDRKYPVYNLQEIHIRYNDTDRL